MSFLHEKLNNFLEFISLYDNEAVISFVKAIQDKRICPIDDN